MMSLAGKDETGMRDTVASQGFVQQSALRRGNDLVAGAVEHEHQTTNAPQPRRVSLQGRIGRQRSQVVGHPAPSLLGEQWKVGHTGVDRAARAEIRVRQDPERSSTPNTGPAHELPRRVRTVLLGQFSADNDTILDVGDAPPSVDLLAVAAPESRHAPADDVGDADTAAGEELDERIEHPRRVVGGPIPQEQRVGSPLVSRCAQDGRLWTRLRRMKVDPPLWLLMFSRWFWWLRGRGRGLGL